MAQALLGISRAIAGVYKPNQQKINTESNSRPFFDMFAVPQLGQMKESKHHLFQ